MNKYSLLLFINVFCLSALWGQGTYKVSVEKTGSYTPLSSDAKQVEIDTVVAKFVDLPFTAKVGKETIEKLKFAPDEEFWGAVGVETEDQTSFQYVIPYNVISLVFLSDLPDYENSGIYYLTEGTEGDRIFKMEWRNIPFFASDESTISFQAWLHEKDNKITYLMGDQKNLNDTILNTKTFIGIFNNLGDSGFGQESFLLTGDVYNPSLESGISFQTEPTALSTAPEVGTKYTITYEKSSSTDRVARDIELTVYPNPASDAISVAMPDGEKINAVHILSMDGKRLSTIRDNFDRIDVSALAAGAYILEVEGEENRSFEKIEIH